MADFQIFASTSNQEGWVASRSAAFARGRQQLAASGPRQCRQCRPSSGRTRPLPFPAVQCPLSQRSRERLRTSHNPRRPPMRSILCRLQGSFMLFERTATYWRDGRRSMGSTRSIGNAAMVSRWPLTVFAENIAFSTASSVASATAWKAPLILSLGRSTIWGIRSGVIAVSRRTIGAVEMRSHNRPTHWRRTSPCARFRQRRERQVGADCGRKAARP